MIKNDSGQMLIETILTLGLVVVVSFALIGLGLVGLRNAKLASDRLNANKAERDGLERIRALRDTPTGWTAITALPVNQRLCFDSDLNFSMTNDCTEVDGSIRDAAKVNGVYERSFKLSYVNRATNAEFGTCPAGCAACGPIVASGGKIDSCTRKVTMQVAWPGTNVNCNSDPVLGTTQSRNCVTTTSIITNWRRD